MTRRRFLKATSVMAAVLPVLLPRGAKAGISQLPLAASNGGGPFVMGRKIMNIDFGMPPAENALSRIDGREIVRIAKRDGADSILVPAKTGYGELFWQSGLGRIYPGLPGELIGDICDEAAKLGLPVGFSFPAAMDAPVYAGNPEWHIREMNNEEAGTNRHRALCINSPFGGIIRSQVADAVKTFSPAAVSLDMFPYTHGNFPLPCYCKSCRQLWEENKYGTSIIDLLNGQNKGLYYDFRAQYLKDFLISIKNEINGEKNTTLLAHNMGNILGAGDVMVFEWDRVDVPMLPRMRHTRSEDGRGNSIISLSRSAREGEYSLKSLGTMTSQTALALSQFNAVSIRDYTYLDGSLDPGARDTIRKTLHSLDGLLGELRGGEPYSEMAVLISGRNYAMHADSPLDNTPDVAGAIEFFNDEHFACEIMPEENITLKSLARLRVIAVPNICTLAAESIKLLKEWCNLGGVLLCDYRTATIDADGNPAEDGGFGVIRIAGDNPDSLSYLQPTLPVGSAYIPVRENVYIRPVARSFPLGFLVRPAAGGIPGEWESSISPPGLNTRLPAGIFLPEGSGYFIYFTSRIFKEYHAGNSLPVRTLLAQALKRASTPFISVKAPRSVRMIPSAVPGGLRIVLINQGNDETESAFSLTGIEIWVDRKIIAASARGNPALPVSVRGTTWVASLPELGIFDVVNLRFE